MYALTLAGIPISIGANEAVHQQRLLDDEAEADERQAEFYLDVFCDAPSRKKDEVDGAIVVLSDGKVKHNPFPCPLFTIIETNIRPENTEKW